jgi:hypothetical protein
MVCRSFINQSMWLWKRQVLTFIRREFPLIKYDRTYNQSTGQTWCDLAMVNSIAQPNKGINQMANKFFYYFLRINLLFFNICGNYALMLYIVTKRVIDNAWMEISCQHMCFYKCFPRYMPTVYPLWVMSYHSYDIQQFIFHNWFYLPNL